MYLPDDFQLSCSSLSAKLLFKHFLSNCVPDLKQFDKEELPLGARDSGALWYRTAVQNCSWRCFKPALVPPLLQPALGGERVGFFGQTLLLKSKGVIWTHSSGKGFSLHWNLGNSWWLPWVISGFSTALSPFQWFLTSPQCDASSPTEPGALFAWEGQQQNKYLPFLWSHSGLYKN